MMVILENGTLRVYHGYDGTPGHCCTLAKAQRQAAEAAHVKDSSKFLLMLKYLESIWTPGHERLASEVDHMMYGFNPGI